MNLLRWFVVGLGVFLAPGALSAQEKIAIKLKELAPGETTRVEVKENASTKFTTTVEKQEPKTQESKEIKHLIFLETVLVRPQAGKLPTKIKRSYETAVRSDEFMKEGPLSYQGKTVLIEKKGEQYEFTLEGGGAIKDSTDLFLEFNASSAVQQKKMLLPPNAVAVGDTWKVDVRATLPEFGKFDKVDIVKADGVAKLVSAVKKDGRWYGTIEVTMSAHFKVKTAIPGGKDEIDSDSKLAIKFKYEGCLDGTVAEGRFAGSYEFQSTTVSRAEKMPTTTSVVTGAGTFDQAWREVKGK